MTLDCVLCGAQGARWGLIEWQTPIGAARFTAAPRCPDHTACRSRVEAAGEKWDVVSTSRSTRELVEDAA